MAFDLGIFNKDDSLSELEADYIEWLIDEFSPDVRLRFNKLWYYYKNPAEGDVGQRGREASSGRCYVQAQEYGLPPRITGLVHSANADVFSGQRVRDVQRKEVVIENDIAWRLNAATDFLFGKPVSFVSKSPDSQKRSQIEAILKEAFETNGGNAFFQDMAVLGSVYGFVDCLVRTGSEILERVNPGGFDPDLSGDLSGSNLKSHPDLSGNLKDVLKFARAIELELIEAPRALPVLEENDYKKTRLYVQHFYQRKNALNKKNTFLARLISSSAGERQVVAVTELISASAWQRYEDKLLVAEGELPWGFLPVVHIQNIAQPYYYEGQSDVEALIPLQDELNTRLSDRASRITFQSFKMYLGKGIEGFEDRPVSPGRMWHTDNPEAAIEEFGGDAATPSEDLHIAEIREAMDKASSVTPLVAGVLKSKLGNLTSAVALRLTLMGMLSKNERKRFTYGQGLKEICKMVLAILDKANIYNSSEADREIEIIFPGPLPENMLEKLKEAQIKKELGVPAEQVLRELGYDTNPDKSGDLSGSNLKSNPDLSGSNQEVL